MQILILNGGKNLRMDGVPKCLTFVKGRTIFEWQYRWIINFLRDTYSHDGKNNLFITVAIGKNTMLKDYFKMNYYEEFSSENCFTPIETFSEDTPLGDAGAIKHYINNFDVKDNFVVFNGDTLSFYNLNNLVYGSEARILGDNEDFCGVLVTKPFSVHLGLLQVQENMIVSFREKPVLDEYQTSCGTYLLNKRILEFLPNVGDFAKDVVAAHSDKFLVHSIRADQWCAVESRKDVDEAERLIIEKNGG